MQKRWNLAGVLAIGCLVAASALQACSSSSNQCSSLGSCCSSLPAAAQSACQSVASSNNGAQCTQALTSLQSAGLCGGSTSQACSTLMSCCPTLASSEQSSCQSVASAGVASACASSITTFQCGLTPTTDGGQPMTDGGPGMTDGGGTVDPHGLGLPCVPPSNGALGQGNCSRELECITGLSPRNMCSKLNCGDPDGGVSCGSTESNEPNICLLFQGGGSLCVRGCDPHADGGNQAECARADFSCQAQSDNPTTPMSCTTDSDCSGDFCVKNVCSLAWCFPDCRTPNNGCGYGGVCDQTNGECGQTMCGGSNPACPSGQVCFTDTLNMNAQYCVPDCRGTSGTTCPSGRTCNMTTGGCDPQVDTQGEICDPTGTQPPICDPTSLCIGFQGATNGLCMQVCATPVNAAMPDAGSVDAGACAMGEACVLGLQDGRTVCTGIPCGGSGMTCPTGTKCGALSGLDAGMMCLPQ